MAQKININKNYNFSKMNSIMNKLDINHSSGRLNELKNELNKFFVSAKCREVIFTDNTDNLFFGMRVYPYITGDMALSILNDSEPVSYDAYYVEIDSKIVEPMLGLNGRELTAMLIHEIGHIVCDTSTTDEVKKHIDKYFANSSESLSIKDSVNYKELLAYGIKDSVVKLASLFSKLGNDEFIADVFVVSCGYGPDLDSGFRKILRSGHYLNKEVDNRFITLSWVLRIYKEIGTRRLPIIKTLNKAKQLSISELDKREISNAIYRLNRLEDPINESVWDNVKSRFNKKFADFKAKGVRSIKDDIYEFNLRLRTIETEEEALLLIRNINNDISILEDYITDPEVTQDEIESITNALQELYSIRQKAAKDANIRSRYDSMIKVVYPNM